MQIYQVAADLTQEQIKRVAYLRRECSAETGVDETVLLNAIKGKIVDDPKLNEHIFCVYKKSNFLDEAGNFHNEVLHKKIADAKNDAVLASKTIEVCSIKKETPQLTSLENYKCLFGKTGIPFL
ncbi:hypothetical protein NQ314_014911 [Rhamnusium bicolor]|uniref:Uncharacterized protein n=1 Tax=Rhamnusium bicolor TaxID=1586634 RepID=A0AAV8X0T3_9CUCU|nr:hypothetical protein NQ314_014911 [Rhamnusium bicolor]